MDESEAISPPVSLEPAKGDALAGCFEAFVHEESARFHGALRLLTRDRLDARSSC